jgi:hypothetical protein
MKFLKWFAIIILVIISLILTLVGYVKYQESSYEKTAVPYVRAAIPAITSWNTQKVRAVMQPQVSQTISDIDLSKLLGWLSKLGALKGIDEPQFNNVFSGVDTHYGSYKIVTYDVVAHFANGDAKIVLRIMDISGVLKVFSFNINSKALMDAPHAAQEKNS